MLRDKLTGVAFAAVIGIVLGVTAWAVSARSGGFVRVESPPTVTTGDDRTEGMIEKGYLSDHPARFWRKDDDRGRRRRRGR